MIQLSPTPSLARKEFKVSSYQGGIYAIGIPCSARSRLRGGIEVKDAISQNLSENHIYKKCPVLKSKIEIF